MNRYEKTKKLTIDEIARLLVTCINSHEEVADFEYISTVLPDIFYDEELCINETKKWLLVECEE